jgi:hypothetical protein
MSQHHFEEEPVCNHFFATTCVGAGHDDTLQRVQQQLATEGRRLASINDLYVLAITPETVINKHCRETYDVGMHAETIGNVLHDVIQHMTPSHMDAVHAWIEKTGLQENFRQREASFHSFDMPKGTSTFEERLEAIKDCIQYIHTGSYFRYDDDNEPGKLELFGISETQLAAGGASFLNLTPSTDALQLASVLKEHMEQVIRNSFKGATVPQRRGPPRGEFRPTAAASRSTRMYIFGVNYYGALGALLLQRVIIEPLRALHDLLFTDSQYYMGGVKDLSSEQLGRVSKYTHVYGDTPANIRRALTNFLLHTPFLKSVLTDCLKTYVKDETARHCREGFAQLGGSSNFDDYAEYQVDAAFSSHAVGAHVRDLDVHSILFCLASPPPSSVFDFNTCSIESFRSFEYISSDQEPQSNTSPPVDVFGHLVCGPKAISTVGAGFMLLMRAQRVRSVFILALGGANDTLRQKLFSRIGFRSLHTYRRPAAELQCNRAYLKLSSEIKNSSTTQDSSSFMKGVASTLLRTYSPMVADFRDTYPTPQCLMRYMREAGVNCDGTTTNEDLHYFQKRGRGPDLAQYTTSVATMPFSLRPYLSKSFNDSVDTVGRSSKRARLAH